MLVPSIGIIIGLLMILGGAGIAGGAVIAVAGGRRHTRLAIWVAIVGIVLSAAGIVFWANLKRI